MFVERFIFGDIKPSEIDATYVRLAYVLRSDQRLNIGSQLFVDSSQMESSIEIYCRNKVCVSPNQPLPNYDWGARPVPEPLRTEIAITVPYHQLNQEELGGLSSGESQKYPLWAWHSVENLIVDAYRRLIVAVDRSLQRSHPSHRFLYAPSKAEVRDHLIGEAWILCPEDYKLTAQDFEAILSYKSSVTMTLSRSIKLSEDEIRRGFGDSIPSTSALESLFEIFRLQQKYIFYEFAHQAITERANDNLPVALIMSMIALEGAHSALLHSTIPDRLPASIKNSDARGYVDRLLRDQGIYALLQVSPYLFLDRELQPDPDLVKSCLNAMEMRNAIMHAKTRRGRPTIRAYDDSQYRNAIDSVLRLYKIFADAVGRAEQAESV